MLYNKKKILKILKTKIWFPFLPHDTHVLVTCRKSYCKLLTTQHCATTEAPEANFSESDLLIKLPPPAPRLTVWAAQDRGHGGTTQSSKSAPYLRDVDRRRRNRWRVVKKNGLPNVALQPLRNLYPAWRNEAAIRNYCRSEVCRGREGEGG